MSISEKFANCVGYSDVTPYEIVRVVSKQTLEIRQMNATEGKWNRNFVAGGFFGTVINQSEQKWVITSDESAPVIRIRLGKSGWRDRGGNRFVLSETPRKFYDYNF